MKLFIQKSIYAFIVFFFLNSVFAGHEISLNVKNNTNAKMLCVTLCGTTEFNLQSGEISDKVMKDSPTSTGLTLYFFNPVTQERLGEAKIAWPESIMQEKSNATNHRKNIFVNIYADGKIAALVNGQRINMSDVKILTYKNCVLCGKPSAKKCSGCKEQVVRYCSHECQKRDWSSHRAHCESKQ